MQVPGENGCWDNWSQTSQLTVEFCLEPPTGQSFPTNTPLLGIGTLVAQPSPFVVSTWNDSQTIVGDVQDVGFRPLAYNQG